jgi:hypothetical protein
MEIPTERTGFSPVAADDILLFSDCRFEIPDATPPTYVVADAELEEPADASIRHLEIRDGELAATIQNSGADRTVTFTGTDGPSTATISRGSVVLTRSLSAGAQIASVQLNGGDLRPENDLMSIRVNPPMASEMWWVGNNPPASEYRQISPGGLPDDPAAYLAPAIIVLNNIEALDLSASSMDHLTQYVRDLGGSLLILGGDRAFGAGEYLGTELEALSPLASAPPEAAVRWVLLVDASGSMAGENWQSATSALTHLLPALPPNDSVTIGQFSDVVRWWSEGKTVSEARSMNLPPADALPHGPTNLEAALDQIAGQVDPSLPSELVLLSDCDAKVDEVAGIIAKFAQKKIHLHVLALGHGSGEAAISQIATASGGEVIEELDTTKWAESARKLGQSAMPPRVVQTPVDVQFLGAAVSIAGVNTSLWDRTWLKQDATLLARTDAGDAMAAVWPVGRGNVGAVGFSPDAATTGALVKLLAQKPRDPRFAVTWDAGEKLRVAIDAAEDGNFINDLPFSLEVQAQSIPIPQTGPGHYEIAMDSPRDSGIASIISQGRVLDRIAVAGRYAPEFDAIGNDHDAMRKLAAESGGAVIGPGDHGPIQFNEPTREMNLASSFAAFGALLLAVGLMHWKRRIEG